MTSGGRKHLFTSESVSMGHPDKVADQISDAMLDAHIAQDPLARVACETLVTTGLVVVAGEITSQADVSVQKVVRDTIAEIGYDDPAAGFDHKSCGVIVALDTQSPDIDVGVTATADHEQGAGDQGLMFGYACRETDVLMPFPIHYAHRLVEGLADLRTNGTLPYLRPDGKSQITVEYDGHKPVRVHTVLLSAQHAPDVEQPQIQADLTEHLIRPLLPAHMVDNGLRILVNPTGRFVVGGPHGDCGVTGRKIIVDTYGGRGSHGGGAFSGKDPSKVDRCASYAARHIAKNIVAAGLADHCEVQLSYAIGVARPLSITVTTYGTAKIPEERLDSIVADLFDLRPAAIIDYYKLRRPIYKQTARHGHFGRTGDAFTWERTERVDDLRKAAGL